MGSFGTVQLGTESASTSRLMTSRISCLPRSTIAHPDSRGQAVLSAIIREHVVTGEAVGSHAISDRFEHAAGWSAATIRYVMGELEESGLLEQPHTSAGRIPTDQGYRYYVDNILGDARLSREIGRASCR